MKCSPLLFLSKPDPSCALDGSQFLTQLPWARTFRITWFPFSHSFNFSLSIRNIMKFKNYFCPDWWLSWLKCRPIHPKGYGFDSRSGHISRLRVRSPDGACMGSTNPCLPLLLPLFPKSINISSGEDPCSIYPLAFLFPFISKHFRGVFLVLWVPLVVQ